MSILFLLNSEWFSRKCSIIMKICSISVLLIYKGVKDILKYYRLIKCGINDQNYEF